MLLDAGNHISIILFLFIFFILYTAFTNLIGARVDDEEGECGSALYDAMRVGDTRSVLTFYPRYDWYVLLCCFSLIINFVGQIRQTAQHLCGKSSCQDRFKWLA